MNWYFEKGLLCCLCAIQWASRPTHLICKTSSLDVLLWRRFVKMTRTWELYIKLGYLMFKQNQMSWPNILFIKLRGSKTRSCSMNCKYSLDSFMRWKKFNTIVFIVGYFPWTLILIWSGTKFDNNKNQFLSCTQNKINFHYWYRKMYQSHIC